MPPDVVLEVSDLHAYYGRALVVEDVSFAVGRESVAILGRNGMGKTTLCKAVMGLHPPRVTGSVRMLGRELCGRPPYAVCRAGIAYVPQGRRLFRSLSTEEHLEMIGGRLRRRGRFGMRDVYELFPRLAARRKVSAAALSGGEQQMLAIGRALLTNPTLLLMDEPSEGLAPAVVEDLVGALQRLAGEGVGLLLVEQNLGVASALADRLLMMVSGRIAHETRAGDLLADEEAQRRFLGVEPLAESVG